MDPLLTFIQALFQHPPTPYNAALKTPKGWVVYCLQDRGLIVDTSVSQGDLRVRSKVGTINFKVSTTIDNLDPTMAWIVIDPSGQSAQVIAAQSATDETVMAN
jgi:hypothetical protein